jgi:hypothetical protein
MSFYHRHKTPAMRTTTRDKESGVLVGQAIEVSLDFVCSILNDKGAIVPAEALGRLDDKLLALFDDKLLIDNNDPHADSLMKLKRIQAASPVLFDHGTSGLQLAFYVGRFVEEWLDREKWNPSDPSDVSKTKIALATVKLGRDEFYYDIE